MSAPIVVAITGASGAVYARRLVAALLEAGRGVHLTISTAGEQVLRHELGLHIDLARFEPRQLLPDGVNATGLRYFHHADFFAPMASGSFLTGGMAICPCSGGTLSGVVTGSASNLIHRAAEVHLKERRKLVLVPRETPLSQVQLENMLRACRLGAVVLPAAPGWYHAPKSLDDLVDFVVARILDQLGVAHEISPRWGADENTPAM